MIILDANQHFFFVEQDANQHFNMIELPGEILLIVLC